MHAHIPIGSGIHICGYLLRALHCVWLLLLFKVYQKFSLFSVTCFVRVVEADPQVIVSQQIVRIPSNPSTKTVRSVRVQSSTLHFFYLFSLQVYFGAHQCDVNFTKRLVLPCWETKMFQSVGTNPRKSQNKLHISLKWPQHFQKSRHSTKLQRHFRHFDIFNHFS